MISNFERQKLIKELSDLEYAINCYGAIEKVEVNELLKRAEELKNEIIKERDVTLEEALQTDAELSLEADIKTRVSLAIEEIKRELPVKYRELKNDIDMNWLQNASKQEKLSNKEKCEEIIQRRPELVRYIPIELIEKNEKFYKNSFLVNGIDMELFLSYYKTIKPILKKTIFKKDWLTEKIDDFNQFNFKRREEEIYSFSNIKYIVENFKKIFDYMPEFIKKENRDWLLEKIQKYDLDQSLIPDNLEIILNNRGEEKEDKKELSKEWRYRDKKRRELDEKWIKYLKIPNEEKAFKEKLKELRENDIELYKKIEKDYIDQILNNKQPMYWDSYISSVPMEIIRGASNFFKEYALKNARIFRYSKNMSTGPDFRFPDDIKLEDIEWTKEIVDLYGIVNFKWIPESGQIYISNTDNEWLKNQIEKDRYNFRRGEGLCDAVKLKNQEALKNLSVEYQPIEVQIPYFYDKLKEKNIDNLNELLYYQCAFIIASEKYINDYCCEKLDFEELKRRYPANERQIEQAKYLENPVFSKTYLAIEGLETTEEKAAYKQSLNSFYERYSSLVSDNVGLYSDDMVEFVKDLAMLEIEVKSKSKFYQDKEMAKEAFADKYKELSEKILEINKMNPTLAREYAKKVNQFYNDNIEYIAKNGNGSMSPQILDVDVNSEYYLQSNTEENSLLPSKKEGFFKSILKKVRGLVKKDSLSDVIDSKNVSRTLPENNFDSRYAVEVPKIENKTNTLTREQLENMSLDELERYSKLIQEIIEDRKNGHNIKKQDGEEYNE